ncbi:hypothetical protein CANARDRAFT_29790 [[Candida] arabinofermentans NRRL YB-2248]|uniref:Stress-associated endoplasmic reticulum protein n=1 Tax=[Candida] arabinofermentans NRRL YB-2248 TaxID=983967 RepID=A0A1E4SVV7_9ASCO|nr:hypothetical protein CANARDRAFT_29790 [[Candida] arabinofermentans NRRL YB-2248]
MALQTPAQRKANEKFAKRNERKLGKPKTVSTKKEYPVSKTWIALFCFLLIGGGVLELLRIFF